MCALREEKQRNVSNASEASETFLPHGPIGLRKAKKCRMSNNWNSNKWNLTMPSFRQVFLPYAFMRLGDGWFLPVNRQYKPLGQSKVKIKGLTDAKAEKLGLTIGGHSYYLYDDATNPQASPANWSRYEAILAKVMKLEVDPAESGNLP